MFCWVGEYAKLSQSLEFQHFSSFLQVRGGIFFAWRNVAGIEKLDYGPAPSLEGVVHEHVILSCDVEPILRGYLEKSATVATSLQ